MESITIYKSPKQAYKLLAICIPFVIIGIWMLSRSETDMLMAVGVVLFFGLGIIVGIVMLFDKKPQIKIDNEGVWDKSTKVGTIPWEKIKEAYPVRINGQGFVSLVLDKEFEDSIKQYTWATNLSKEAGATKINIYLGQTNNKPEDVSDLINIRIGNNSKL